LVDETDVTMSETHVTKGCFGCGTENAAGLGLRPRKDGGWVRADFTPRPHHHGMSRVVHGGIVASALDEILTCAASVELGEMAATVALEVEFLAPMPLRGQYEVRARYTGPTDRLHGAEGEVADAAGKVLARARGRFVALTADRVKKFVDKVS